MHENLRRAQPIFQGARNRLPCRPPLRLLDGMPALPTVLHYVGADDDRGGIVSTVRALTGETDFAGILGLNAGGKQHRTPLLPSMEFTRLEGETISLANFWRARIVAREVQQWLREDDQRIFHGHSRAGLLVALWLHYWREQRVVVSVHCYGKQRWFYRWAAHRLGNRLFWLSPAMRKYYDMQGAGWERCIPECVRANISPILRVPSQSLVRIAGVGFLVRWKGWHDVIEALALLPVETRARVRFDHIGPVGYAPADKRYAEELWKKTEAAGLAGCVRWLGEQPSSTPLLNESDCLVIASRNEPFSLAMLEALHAGVPLLAADSGGATDVVTLDRNGWLYRTGDPADLARLLRSLIETDALTRIRIDAGQLERFSAAVVAAQWREVYARLV